MKKKKVFLHKDNAPGHTSMKIMTKQQELYVELLLCSPYSPDLAPGDICWLEALKKCLQERNLVDKDVRKPLEKLYRVTRKKEERRKNDIRTHQERKKND